MKRLLATLGAVLLPAQPAQAQKAGEDASQSQGPLHPVPFLECTRSGSTPCRRAAESAMPANGRVPASVARARTPVATATSSRSTRQRWENATAAWRTRTIPPQGPYASRRLEILPAEQKVVGPPRVWKSGTAIGEQPAADRCSSSGDASRAAGDETGTVLGLSGALCGRRAAGVAGDVPGLRR